MCTLFKDNIFKQHAHTYYNIIIVMAGTSIRCHSLWTRLEKGENTVMDITYTLLSTQQEIRLTQLDPAYPEEEIEGETASGEESESGDVRESTSTPTEDNQSDEQDEKGSDEDEFELAFGSGDDDNN